MTPHCESTVDRVARPWLETSRCHGAQMANTERNIPAADRAQCGAVMFETALPGAPGGRTPQLITAALEKFFREHICPEAAAAPIQRSRAFQHTFVASKKTQLICKHSEDRGHQGVLHSGKGEAKIGGSPK